MSISHNKHDFSTLYGEYYPKIVRYLKRLVGDLEAEDIAQEVFVKIGHSLDTFRNESSLSTWIYRIATNTAMDHLRKPSSRSAQLVDDSSPADDEDTTPDSSPLHDTLLVRKDMNECIRGIVDHLPEDHRAVLVLSEFEDMTNAEIGEVLGISLDTTKIRLHRARTRARERNWKPTAISTVMNGTNSPRPQSCPSEIPQKVTLSFGPKFFF